MTEPSFALELLRMILENRIYFYRSVYVVIMIWAFWKGAGPERAIAYFFTALFVMNRLYRDVFGQTFQLDGVDYFSLSVDILMCTGLIAIALQANRIYPLWIAGLQIISLLAHLARAVAPDIALLAYAILVMAPSYGQLLAFALGMRAHRKRVARHGKYRSWRGSWPRLPGMKRAS